MWPVSDSEEEEEEEEEESDSDSDSESSVASDRGDSKSAAHSEGEESGVDMEVDQEHNAPPKHQGGQMEIDQEQNVPLEPEGAEEIQPEKNGQPEHQVAEQMEVETEKNAQPEPKVAEVESGVAAGSPQPEKNVTPKHQVAEPIEVEREENAPEVESGEAAGSPQPEKNAPPQPQVAEPIEVEREENAPEVESGVAVGSPHQEPPTAQAQNAAYGDQSGQEASTKVASTSKSILTSSTKHKTLANAKRKPPETDIIDFGEETKNTKRLKQQASWAATDRGRGHGRCCSGGSARGCGASARRSGQGG
jgi:pilus assembly protein FimV